MPINTIKEDIYFDNSSNFEAHSLDHKTPQLVFFKNQKISTRHNYTEEKLKEVFDRIGSKYNEVNQEISVTMLTAIFKMVNAEVASIKKDKIDMDVEYKNMKLKLYYALIYAEKKVNFIGVNFQDISLLLDEFKEIIVKFSGIENIALKFFMKILREAEPDSDSPVAIKIQNLINVAASKASKYTSTFDCNIA